MNNKAVFREFSSKLFTKTQKTNRLLKHPLFWTTAPKKILNLSLLTIERLNCYKEGIGLTWAKFSLLPGGRSWNNVDRHYTCASDFCVYRRNQALESSQRRAYRRRLWTSEGATMEAYVTIFSSPHVDLYIYRRYNVPIDRKSVV